MNFDSDTVIAGTSCDDMITISGVHDLVSTSALQVSVASFASADTVVGGGAGSTFTLEGAGTITANNFGFIDVANGVNGTADITVSQFASSSGFDLSGDTMGHLTFDAIGPTSFSFFDVAGKGQTGTTRMHGVQTLTLEGGSYNLAIDATYHFGNLTIDASQLTTGNTLNFDDNSFYTNVTILSGGDGDTLRASSNATLGGADTFGYLATADSFSNAGSAADSHTDLIQNFQDNFDSIDFQNLAGAGSETVNGSSNGTFGAGTPFTTAFAGGAAGIVDYAVIGGDTFVHVHSGVGYSAGDLLIELQGNHTLSPGNFHPHA